MARHQYRIAGKSRFPASPGCSVIGIANRNGSGKIVRLRSCEVSPTSFASVGNPGSLPLQWSFLISRTTIAEDGRVITPQKLNVPAPDWPSSIVVSTLAGYTAVGDVIRSLTTDQRANNIGAPLMAMTNERNLGESRWRGSLARKYRAPLQPITIRPGEAVSLIARAAVLGSPYAYVWRVAATLRDLDTNRIYTVNLDTQDVINIGTDTYLTVRNGSGGTVVEIVDLEVGCVGAETPPMVKLLRGGEPNEGNADPLTVVTASKVDSASPDVPVGIEIRENTSYATYDVNSSFIVDDQFLGSTSYHTMRPLIGPEFRRFQASTLAWTNGLRLPDTLGADMPARMADLGVRGSDGLVAREGQSIVLTQSITNLRGGDQPQGPCSIIALFHYALTFDVIDDETDFVFDPPHGSTIPVADPIVVDVLELTPHVEHTIRIVHGPTGMVEQIAYTPSGGLPAVKVPTSRYVFASERIEGGYRYTINDPSTWREVFDIQVQTCDSLGRNEIGAASFSPVVLPERLVVTNLVPANGSTVAPTDTITFDTTAEGSYVASWFLFAGYQDPGELIGVETFECAALVGFGVIPMPGYSVVEQAIPNGFRVTLGRDGGWKRPFVVAVAAADGGIPELALGITSAFPFWTFDVNPTTEYPDSSAPVTAVVSPAPGTPISPSTLVVFDVTDDSGAFRRILVAVYFAGTGITELVHDGDAFLGRFAHCTRTPIVGGFRYTIAPNTGWPSTPTLRIFAIDQTGKEV